MEILKNYWILMMGSECVIESNDKKIVFTEKSRKCEFINEEQKIVYRYNIDKCLMQKKIESKKCDYGLKTETKFYFIELKGTNIIRGCQQIYDTINFFKENRNSDLNELSLEAVIVPTKNSVPQLKSDPNYVKLYRLLENKHIKIKSRTYSIKL